MKVIGYGSLLNETSRKHTIPHDVPTTKVWVHGFKRILDLESIKTHIAVMNVEPEEGAKFNALVFDFTNHDLEELKKREATYKQIRVRYTGYDSDEEGEAILFVGFEQQIHHNLHPDKHYLHVCREGAYQISESFGRDFDKTTFGPGGENLF